MKRTITFVLFFSAAFTFSYSQTWTQKVDFPGTERQGAVNFVIGNTAYAGLGKHSSTYFTDFWQYDALNDSWSQIADFPGAARAYAVAFVLDGKGYVGLGESASGFFISMYEFDPTNGSWTQVGNFGALARSRAVSFVIGDVAYVGTGNSTSGELKGFHAFDGANWSTVAGIDTWRKDAFGFAINGKGYVTGGNLGGTFYTDMLEYDPMTNSWTSVTSGTVALNHLGATGFTIDGKAYFGYGSNTRFTEYDPLSNQATNLGDVLGLDSERTHGVGFVIGNMAYLGLGCGDPGIGCLDRKDIWAAEFEIVTVPLTADLDQTSSILCFGDATASIVVTASGGTPPYTYNWSPGTVTGPEPTGLTAGTYSVTITDSEGEEEILSIDISQPNALVGTTTSEPEMNGNDGSVSITVTGGIPTYSYLWDTTPPANTPEVDGLPQGEYTVTVTDLVGCTLEETVVVDFVDDTDEAMGASLTIAPTLAQGSFAILSQVDVHNLEVVLTDQLGRQVKSWEDVTIGQRLDLSGLQHNLYFVIVKLEGQVQAVRKLIVLN